MLDSGVKIVTPCIFLLIRKIRQARLFFERMLGYSNHLGLNAKGLASSGEHLGNFPQAFTPRAS
jgi:hypothetical protein